MSGLTAVSLFAGVGGIDLALERAGVAVKAAVEIDPACRGIIRRHFPQTALFNDVTEVTGDQLRAAGFVPGRGILAGGSPCQDLSIAGRRAGLGGARSGLFWHFMRVADELRPRWILFENVPGLLSACCDCPGDGTCTASGRAMACGRAVTVRDGSQKRAEWHAGAPHTVTGGTCPGGCIAAHGGAMGTVLGALGDSGYGFAYRVLDSRFFGLAQRRERVFIVGCLGDRASPVEVLLEPEGGAGHPEARGQAGAGPAAGAGTGSVATLQGGGRRGHRIDAEGAAGGHLIAVGVSENQRGEVLETRYSRQLTTGGGKPGQGYGAVRQGTGVRRLTPLEYERLQGLPDAWTRWLADGAEQSDSARYRQCGNSVPVPVVQWIARRVVAVDGAAQAEGAA
jgi:DNA (cytosine-5)-methyltransferase 1